MQNPLFTEREQQDYDRMRLGKLFDLYLSMYSRWIDENIHPQDEIELKKVESALTNRSLPEKYRFYLSLTRGEHQELYKENFLVLH